MLICESFCSISGRIENILLFGLVHKVKQYTEKAEKQAIENGLYFYCYVSDKQGNKYKLFSDYDPCLSITNTIAFKI